MCLYIICYSVIIRLEVLSAPLLSGAMREPAFNLADFAVLRLAARLAAMLRVMRCLLFFLVMLHEYS